MLRISPAGSSKNAVALRLDGQVTGERWIAELRRCCDQVLSRHALLTLDLAGVTFVGKDGITLLRSLTVQGAILTNTSPFVAEQLKGEL